MDSDREVVDDVESNAPASTQRTAPSESRPTNPATQHPPPPPNPHLIPVAPQGVELVRLNKPPIDKIRKQGAEEFRANVDDDLDRAEFLLENSIRNTLVSVVPREKATWDFFLEEFRKKYISERFIDQKHKEFLELKKGQMTEFVRLSKYARECVSTEAIMCKRFEDGLNEDIRLLIGILELKEFVMQVEQACKAEELSKEKRKFEFEARNSRKRLMNKSFQSSSKKSRDMHTYSNASAGYPNRAHAKAQTTSIVSVGNARSNKPKCQHYGRRHPSECRMNKWACFKCSSQDHFIRDCPEMVEKDNFQNVRSSNTIARRRPVRNARNGTSSRGVSKDSVYRRREHLREHLRELMPFVLAMMRPPLM
ncbi:Gag-Pol polyprotein [Gossypium australe]|uniref:Gag-Pol polyprotein n=1 Tax=Gossypium australe TaxID=47621 RepID=A0A5B6V9D9_9ROSI|nr:Gag-Pol polyprotein [Gossypium australe]